MRERLRLGWNQRMILQKQEGFWRNGMKLVLFFAFVAGILFANLMGREQVSGIGILNDYFIERFQYHGVKGESLFYYILGERMPMLLLLLLLAFSSLGIFCGFLLLGWQGFSIGFMMATAIAKYGVKGILLILGGIFPQYLLYLPVYLFYCYFTVYLRRHINGGTQEIRNERDKGRYYGAGVLVAFVLLFFFTAGIFLESYVNPPVLQKILKIF